MMKKQIASLILVSFISSLITAQTKKFTVLDSFTNLPIDLVHVSYPDLEIGSITNADGLVSIPIKDDVLEFSHIEYKTKRLSKDEFLKTNTIYLEQNRSELQEIVLYNVNLRDKISQALKKVKKNYGTKKIVHKGTYKETYRVNDSISRLFQTQIQWWSKNSIFDFNKWVFSQNKVIIDNVDYSKVFKFDKTQLDGKGGFIENKYFFQYVHINYLLYILKNLTQDFEIQSINKGSDQISIVFDAAYLRDKKKIFTYRDCHIVFDSSYERIKFIKLNMDYELNFEKDITSIDSIPYEKASKSHMVELSFSKNLKRKYTLNYFISDFVGYIKFQDKPKYKVAARQSLFVTESNVKQPFDDDYRIDLMKPFYASLPEKQKKTNVKILLTKEEEVFLKKSE